MIVTLSGITGTGKSFFKNVIVEELGFKNLVIVTTRKIRENEINGVDKEFVDDKKFEELVRNNKLKVNFEFLGSKYGYRTEKIESDEDQVTEVHYSTIYNVRKHFKNIFSIYIIPEDIERAKLELKKRNLSKEVEMARLKEIDEHIEEYKTNKNLREQFDAVLTNDYTEKSKKELIDIIKKEILLRKEAVKI
jgi:guanylate kinase